MWAYLLPAWALLIINAAAHISGAHVSGFRVISEYYDPSQHQNLSAEALYNRQGNARPVPGNGGRPGSATNTHSCDYIRAVPSHLRSAEHMWPSGLGNFYQKYTEAYGIPVLGSNALSDSALQRCCYTVRFMLADRYSVRNSYYKKYGRFALMGVHEVTTDIPEHKSLGPWWDKRARGLGATESRPVSTGGEENALCLANDRYRPEDILLHEFSHGLHLLGARFAMSNFDSRLKSLYNSAKYAGKWANTYAISNDVEYFAEGVQSYFSVNAHADPADGVHGPISTREKLRGYDLPLYNFIRDVFTCDNTYIKRCLKDRRGELSQVLKINCPGREDCKDNNQYCPSWAAQGECTKNPAYMRINCMKSCNLC